MDVEAIVGDTARCSELRFGERTQKIVRLLPETAAGNGYAVTQPKSKRCSHTTSNFNNRTNDRMRPLFARSRCCAVDNARDSSFAIREDNVDRKRDLAHVKARGPRWMERKQHSRPNGQRFVPLKPCRLFGGRTRD